MLRKKTNRDHKTTGEVVVDHDGRTQVVVVVAATQRVRSYDFASGELVREAAGLGQNRIPAPVQHGDLVYVMSGFMAPT